MMHDHDNILPAMAGMPAMIVCECGGGGEGGGGGGERSGSNKSKSAFTAATVALCGGSTALATAMPAVTPQTVAAKGIAAGVAAISCAMAGGALGDHYSNGGR